MLTQSSTLVTIDWTAPNDYGVSIDAYQILIIDSTGAFVEDTAICDGSDSTVVSNTYCTFSMSSLRSSPFNLVFNDEIKAKVLAHNARGWSSASSIGSGLYIQTEPVAMSAPTRGSSTSTS